MLAAAGFLVRASYKDAARVPDEWNDNSRIVPFELDLASQAKITSSEIVLWLAHISLDRYDDAESTTNTRAINEYFSSIDPSQTRKVVFISSGGSVYGPPENLPISEGHPLNPISPYGVAKQDLEAVVTAFGERTSISTAILRPGNIYGFEKPGRRSKGVIGAFLRKLTAGGNFELVHGGRTIRDLIHVDDVSRAILAAIEDERAQTIWNVGTGVGTSTIDVLEKICELANLPMPELPIVENYSTDVLENVLDISKIIAESSWTPEISLESGLKRTLERWGGEGVS